MSGQEARGSAGTCLVSLFVRLGHLSKPSCYLVASICSCLGHL